MRLSLIIVCYGEELTPLLDALGMQKAPGDELILVDNKAHAGGTPSARGHAAVDRLIEPQGNLHYASGMNLGARAATGDAVVLLNPDAVPEPGFLDALRSPPDHWEGWTAVLTLRGGQRVNNAGGQVHFLGLAWSGRFGQSVQQIPGAPYHAGFLSGGCLAVRRDTWRALGGYPEHYGVYHEDVDLSLRLRLGGAPFGVVPAARLAHDYDFFKNRGKWRNLERNRWKTIVRTYPRAVLLATLPMLIAAEVALLAVSVRRGWAGAKLKSYADVARWLGTGLRERRVVQAAATVSPSVFAAGLVAELDSPFLGRAGRSRVVNRLLTAYWTAVRARLPD